MSQTIPATTTGKKRAPRTGCLRVSDLTGPALDYWAARADGQTPERIELTEHDVEPGAPLHVWLGCGYSKNWEQAGLVLDRELISVYASVNHESGALDHWVTVDEKASSRHGVIGPTAAVAAMRAFVRSKFGDIVAQEPTL